MNKARLAVIVGFFLTVSTIVIYKVITDGLVDPALKQAKIAYETQRIQFEQERLRKYTELELEKIRLQRANLRRYERLNFYGTVLMLVAIAVSLIILAIGYSRAKIQRDSVHIAHIGQHSAIPVHHKDLQTFYPIAVNLSLAEIEASVSSAHDSAYRISRQMIEDITEYTRAIAGKRGIAALSPGDAAAMQFAAPVLTATPTFADLLGRGLLAPGKPLIVGYDRQGQPQYRALQDLKSMAIAGWQGSGKTISTGYMVASSVLAYGVQAYIIDPHKHHHESLYTLIKPLERTGRLTIINPFDTPALLDELNRTLDRRLAGQESSDQGILLVIDELARLAKMECFDRLITFLERCTEETRKANITFIGGSPKWTARHFKGRADIRGCMNSMLIHKTKPSQAELLIEDAHDKNLVKHLHQPGEAVLVTDYDSPTLVAMPICTRKDMETVAGMICSDYGEVPAAYTQLIEIKSSTKSSQAEGGAEILTTPLEESSSVTPVVRSRPPEPEATSVSEHRNKSHPVYQIVFDAKQLTAEILREELQKRKTQDARFTQAEFARQAGMSQSYLSRILNEKVPFSDQHKQLCYRILFDKRRGNKSHRSWLPFRFKKAATG